MLINMSLIQDLVQTFSPVCYFDKDENFFPCSIEWYLQHCKLYNCCGGSVLADFGQLTPENLTDLNDNNPTSELWFDPAYICGLNTQSRLNTAPCYVDFSQNEDKSEITLQFSFLYGFNGSSLLNCCPCVENLAAGEHYGELEHMSIVVDNDTFKPKRIYYAAHGAADGEWVDAENVQWYNQTHPKVFIALHSHGTYKDDGNHYRILGITNDRVNVGKMWIPTPILISDNTHWNTFNGYLGQPTENHMPKLHAWWHGKDPSCSNNWFTRLFSFCRGFCD